MNRPVESPEIGPPLGAYSHAIETSGNSRIVHVSGQVGVLPDGRIAQGIEAQLECCWHNILAILSGAGMAATDIVKVNTYVTSPEYMKIHPRIRLKFLGEARPAATGVCVSALATPDFLCEIEVVAAKSDGPVR
jgi:2-iminobutanoate/2-iminopropanoate deaminase